MKNDVSPGERSFVITEKKLYHPTMVSPLNPSSTPHRSDIPSPAFFSLLAEQHLLAAMIELFHRSLMAESRFRLNHIEAASRRMEQRSADLKRKQNLARQEEIIEEIEILNSHNEKSKAMALLEEAKRDETIDPYQYEQEYLLIIKEF